MPDATSPDWEVVLSTAARLQRILPEAVLVGGTAAAVHARHRLSKDADHTLTDLRTRFDEVLARLESVAGWRTARVNRPVLIRGSLDGIETGIRQLMRSEPLETTTITHRGEPLTVPTLEEMLRIKAVLILRRNATRDYLDFVALGAGLGEAGTARAMRRFDALYPQPDGQSALQQLLVQLSHPLPFDLEGTRLDEYRDLDPKWQDWNRVEAACAGCAASVFESLAQSE